MGALQQSRRKVGQNKSGGSGNRGKREDASSRSRRQNRQDTLIYWLFVDNNSKRYEAEDVHFKGSEVKSQLFF